MIPIIAQVDIELELDDLILLFVISLFDESFVSISEEII